MIPWDKLHGAMTRFPIALLLFSTGCDFVSVTLKKLPFARELRSVSRGRCDFGWHHPPPLTDFGLLFLSKAIRSIANRKRPVHARSDPSLGVRSPV
jgi:hypothetical protein